MLFKMSFHSLEIYVIIAWLSLLFQSVIFFTENSMHYKQTKVGARMGVFLFGNRPAHYCEKQQDKRRVRLVL